MLEAIYKKRDVTGSGSLWGVFNNTPNLTCSPQGYLLTVTSENICRLDDLDVDTEAAFWDFSFSQAAHGIVSATARGMAPLSNEIANSGPVYATCMVNDGAAAWQSVGTVHGHVIWLSDAEIIGDMKAHLVSDRARFLRVDGLYVPLDSVEVVLTPDRSGTDIREARQSLSSRFNNAVDGDLGFSHYLKKPCQGDPRGQDARLIIEAWSLAHHAVASLSGFVRHWNGLIETPVSPHPIGIVHPCFRPIV